ncbi:MAG: hypothetical protein MZV49_14000 [Rhodopseudomonas palustris]|nr:hypothetical protein [Rhodopseudomonas palustris]
MRPTASKPNFDAIDAIDHSNPRAAPKRHRNHLQNVSFHGDDYRQIHTAFQRLDRVFATPLAVVIFMSQPAG